MSLKDVVKFEGCVTFWRGVRYAEAAGKRKTHDGDV